jgi:iron complex transport system permease protein
LFKRHNKLILFFVSLLILAAVSLLASLWLGSVPIQPGDLLHALTNSDDGLHRRIILELRWPRAATAFLCGGLLALAGVLMQVLLRNPLADPYILGISGGAATAALLAITLGLSSYWLTPAAFSGAALAMLLVYLFAAFARNTNRENPLLLVGIVLAAGWGALINLLLILADSHNVHSMLFWLMGDLSAASLPGAPVILVLIVSLLTSWYYAGDLNLLMLGDNKAKTLGSEVTKVRGISFIIAAVCTAVAVSLAGTIGFIGLIVPHLLRHIIGANHRLLLPAAVLAGGTLLTIADLGARTLLAPQQLPVGVITAMIGVPIFLYLLVKKY